MLMLLRPFTFAAIALVAGIGFCYSALFEGGNVAFAFLTLAFPLCFVIFSKRKWAAIATFGVFLLCLCIGMGAFALQVQSYNRQRFPEGRYSVLGEVDSCLVGENYSVLVLHDVFIDGQTSDGNVKVYVYSQDYFLESGTVVEGEVTLSPVGSAYAFRTFRSDMVVGNIRYTSKFSTPLNVVRHNFRLFSALNATIRQTLSRAMGREEAAVAYALTTGSTAEMDEDLLASVRFGGVAHLFAVSGLHIGIVFSLLSVLCKRLPPWCRIAIPVAGCFLFCGICNFTASSVRAFIILSLGTVERKLLYRKTDGLELTAIAALFILLPSPAQLFSVGFRLSFLAFLGVAVIAPYWIKKSKEYGFYPKNKLISSVFKLFVGLTAVQACLLPQQLISFGYASVGGMLFNVILVPFFSLFFPIYLILLAVSCVIPPCAGTALFFPNFVFSLFVRLFSAADFSAWIFGGIGLGGGSVAIYYLILFLISGKINVNSKPIVLFLSVLFFAQTAYVNAPALYDFRITQMCYYDQFCCALLEEKEEKTLLINGEANPSRLRNFLYRHTTDCKGIKVVIVSSEPIACINSLVELGFEEYYVREKVETGLQRAVVHVTGKSFSIGGVKLTYCLEGGMKMEYKDKTGTFCADREEGDFSVFYSESRDGLIFSVKDDILTVSRN